MSRQRAPMRRAAGRTGFTLIELVIVLVLTGILSVGLGNLLQRPINAYGDLSRRAELVSLANLAMQRMARDLRSALPNSIRVSGGGRVLELLHTTGGARYRLDPGINDPGGPNQTDHTAEEDWLSFGGDASWNVLGRFRNFSFAYGTPLPVGTRIAIYPASDTIWSQAALDTSPGAITPGGSRITLENDVDEDQILLDASHQFTFESPERRLFIVDTPITYLCDPADGSFWRVSRYTVTGSQPTDRTLAPLAAGQVDRAVDRVESCSFSYVPGTATRSGLVTAELVLAAGGERVRLLQQIHVTNAP